MRPLTRITPQLPVTAVKTYQIIAPPATHWRPATCSEVSCEHYLHGWRTVIDEGTDLGKRQASYIRHQAGRQFDEFRDGALTEFVFEPGQRCFATHRARLDRPEIYLAWPGDWRGRTGEPRRHVRAADWVEDFAEHQQYIADRLERG